MQGIQYLTHTAINKQKWDECMQHADNSLVYGFSFYLDTMADNWDALVFNDYEMVMPLPYRKKYSIQYLYQPAFTAMLGIFGKGITTTHINAFINAIPSSFKYIDIYLNAKNNTDELGYRRDNYELNLNDSYEFIQQGYRDNLKRNIAKCYKANCTSEKNVAIEKVIALANIYRKTNDNTSAIDFDNFAKLYQQVAKAGKINCYGVFSKTQQLLASACFIIFNNRAYYILVGNHPDGKTIGASHALIDAFIKDHASRNLILDFEGSDVPSLAFFYSSYGAVPIEYTGLRINRLSKLLRWMKN